MYSIYIIPIGEDLIVKLFNTNMHILPYLYYNHW